MSNTATNSQLLAAKEAFAVNKDKSVKQAFVTSDDQVFFGEDNARNHSKELKESVYVTVTREEAAKAKSETKEDK